MRHRFLPTSLLWEEFIVIVIVIVIVVIIIIVRLAVRSAVAADEI